MKTIIEKKKTISFECNCWCIFKSNERIKEVEHRQNPKCWERSLPSPPKTYTTYTDTCPNCWAKNIKY